MNRVQQQFICDAMDAEHLLTEWEQQFISDLADKADSYELSDRQNEILNRISQKVNRGH